MDLNIALKIYIFVEKDKRGKELLYTWLAFYCIVLFDLSVVTSSLPCLVLHTVQGGKTKRGAGGKVARRVGRAAEVERRRAMEKRRKEVGGDGG